MTQAPWPVFSNGLGGSSARTMPSLVKVVSAGNTANDDRRPLKPPAHHLQADVDAVYRRLRDALVAMMLGAAHRIVICRLFKIVRRLLRAAANPVTADRNARIIEMRSVASSVPMWAANPLQLISTHTGEVTLCRACKGRAEVVERRALVSPFLSSSLQPL